MPSDLHQQLVDRAGRWLRNTVGCRLVLTEPRCWYTQEQPDALGWQGVDSWLIEVKVSRSDFLRDRNKLKARTGEGLGLYRFYLTPPAMLTQADLPPGWGLLELHVDKVRNLTVDPAYQTFFGASYVKRPARNECRDFQGEIGFLIAVTQGKSAAVKRGLAEACDGDIPPRCAAPMNFTPVISAPADTPNTAET